MTYLHIGFVVRPIKCVPLTKNNTHSPPHNFASSFIADTIPPLAHTSPPSTVIVAPLICELALLDKNTTSPAISSAFPSLLLGLLAAKASAPPLKSSNPFAIFEGKNPGAIEFTRICLGPNSTAKFLARWMTAALDAEYPKVAFFPKDPTPIPATDAVMMTRDGSSMLPFFCKSGAKLMSQLVPFLYSLGGGGLTV